MHVIKTTLSFAIHWYHTPVSFPTKMIRSATQYTLTYVLCAIILYGFVIIEMPPMDPKQNKWWNYIWDTSFQYLVWGAQPMVQYLTNDFLTALFNSVPETEFCMTLTCL